MKKPAQPIDCAGLILVGARGFEPPTTCTPCSREISRNRPPSNVSKHSAPNSVLKK